MENNTFCGKTASGFTRTVATWIRCTCIQITHHRVQVTLTLWRASHIVIADVWTPWLLFWTWYQRRNVVLYACQMKGLCTRMVGFRFALITHEWAVENYLRICNPVSKPYFTPAAVCQTKRVRIKQCQHDLEHPSPRRWPKIPRGRLLKLTHQLWQLGIHILSF